MSTDVQPWQEPAAPVAHLVSAPPAPAASDIDSWVAMASSYTTLANQIANTDFVPKEMRGKPAAVTAAFLAGREMGLPPMTALMNLHVINGKVGQSAHLMRAMIQAAGHELEYDETNDSRCVCRGRRQGEQNWLVVTFTADQARRAKIDLGNYPEDKLVARATARVARRKFADVIAGMEFTTEELTAGDYVETDVAPLAVEGTTEEAPPPARTARRPATRTRSTSAPARASRTTSTSTSAAAAAPSAPSGPPLPGEEDDQDAPGDVTATAVVSGGPGEGGRRDQARQPAQEPDGATAAGPGAPPPADEKPAAPQARMITKNQSGKLHALFNDAKVSDRAARLRVVSSLVDRQVGSSSELTQDEASELIDELVKMGPDDIAAVADPGNRPAEGQGQLGDDEPVDAELVEDETPAGGS